MMIEKAGRLEGGWMLCECGRTLPPMMSDFRTSSTWWPCYKRCYPASTLISCVTRGGEAPTVPDGRGPNVWS